MYTKRFNPTRNYYMDMMVPFNFGDIAAEVFSNDENFFRPRTDVAETETQFELHISLPGMKKEDIKIEMKDDELNISGERKEVKEENKTFHRTENRYGKFSRSFRLNDNADAKNISAEFKNGILEVIIAKTKKEEAKATVIEVK